MNRIKRLPRIPVWYVLLIVLGAGLWLGIVQAAPLAFRSSAASASAPVTSATPTPSTSTPSSCRDVRARARAFAHPFFGWGWAERARYARRAASNNPQLQACRANSVIWHPRMLHRGPFQPAGFH